MSFEAFVMFGLLCFVVALTLVARAEEDARSAFSPLKGLSILSELNPSFTYDGKKIVQGDIAVPRYWSLKNNREEMKGIVNPVTFWSPKRIPYEFHTSIDDDRKTMILGAMEEWEKHSCLRFRERVWWIDMGYLRFRADKEGCWSMIGKSTVVSPQDVSIGRGCNRSNIVIHEIGHAIGFYHEQSRNDRDGYIHINWHNMPNERYSQFDRGIENPRGVEYDYTSIMHYGPMAFTDKFFQKNTIASLNPHHQTLIGSGEKITFRDAKLINMMYKCSDGCPNRNESGCLNGGFLSPYRGENQPCECVCPPGASGTLCETITEPLEYYRLPPCGGNITEETEIQTPGYPNRGPKVDSCCWWIQAPEGKEARVEFLDFSFHERMAKNDSMFYKRCYHERVEVRVSHRYDGDMFCGEDIPKGTVATSVGREFIIIIDTNEKGQSGRGLKAKVTFVNSKPEDPSHFSLKSLLPQNL